MERLAEQGHEVTVICAQGGYAGGERKEVIGDQSSVLGEENCSGASPTVAFSSDFQPVPLHHQPSTLNHQLSPTSQLIHILRVPATQFGRGSAIHKLIDYASFYLMVAWKLAMLRPRPDRVVALTTPPYLSVLTRLISKFQGADHAHWVMDLYPDVMVAHGMLSEGSWKHRLLAGIAGWGFGGKRCKTVLTLGPDMAERVARVICSGVSATVASSSASQTLHHQPSTLPPARPSCDSVGEYEVAVATVAFNSQLSPDPQFPTVQWVPLWGGDSERVVGKQYSTGSASVASSSDSQPSSFPDHQHSTLNSQLSSTLRAQRGWHDGELVVMYSGNMGLGHRFGEFLEASLQSCSGTSATVADISDSNDQPIRFVFYGGGKRRVEIENFISQHPDCRVELHDYAPAEELSAHLLSADVHLASLDAAWSGTMVPSKLQGIFAVGRPVIFVGCSQSSIGRWVTESGGGWVVEPGDVSGLLAALGEARDREIRNARGQTAGQFAASHFDKATNARRVAAIFTR